MADRIVKSVALDAPPHQVWPALTDAKAFGANAGGWEKQMDLIRTFVEKH